jgi:hypothetical protein
MTTQTQLAKAAAKKKVAKPRAPAAPLAPGEAAANSVLGKNNLAAGNYIADRYVPPAQQIGVGPSGAVTDSLNTAKGLTNLTPEQIAANGLGMDAAKNGYSANQFQGLRDQQNRGLQSAYATSASQLAKAQARGKVYGAAGAAQQNNLIRNTEDQRFQNEQDLLVKGADYQQNALTNVQAAQNAQRNQQTQASNVYTTGAQAADQTTTDQQKFNAGEADATTAARLGAVFNTAAVGQNNANNSIQSGLGADSVKAAGGSLANYNRAVGLAKTATGRAPAPRTTRRR